MTPTQRSELVARLRGRVYHEQGGSPEPDPLAYEAADAIESDALTISDLERKIGMLREALAPFANAVTAFAGSTDNDGYVVYAINGVSLVVGDFRRARSVLSDIPPVKSKDA